MALIKNKTKRENYLVVSKIFLQDESLSLTERGLLATLHSFPENWDFSIRGTSKIIPDGEAKIKKALDGLICKGYVEIAQSKNERGQYGNNEISIYEKPIRSLPLPENPVTDNPVTVNPVAEKPSSGNTHQYSNKGCNIKKSNNKKINNGPSIHLSYGTSDGETTKTYYEKLIADNIHLDWLMEKAERLGHYEVDNVKNIYSVICDMVINPRKKVRIKGIEYPWDTVKAQFLKLNHDNICSILDRIIDESLDVHNMHSYLISTLYTESLAGNIQADASDADEYRKLLRGTPFTI